MTTKTKAPRRPKKQTGGIRNRIKELRHVPAAELRANPRNWRTHPVNQSEALKGILAEVGSGDKLTDLLKDVEVGNKALRKMFEDLTPADMIEFSEPPSSVEENIAHLESIKAQRKKANESVAGKHDTEKYLVIVFNSREHKESMLKELGLPSDERYVPVASVTIKPRSLVRHATSNGRSIKSAKANKSGANG